MMSLVRRWRRRSVFADDLITTTRAHPALKERGFAFDVTPHLLENRAAFHDGCEALRLALLDELGREAPIHIWRLGEVVYHRTPTRQVVELRARAGGTTITRDEGEGASHAS